MRIVPGREHATLLLVAVSAEEEAVIGMVSESITRGDKIDYLGREKDSDSRFVKLRFNAGGVREQKSEVIGTTTFAREVSTGGVDFMLCGTKESDKREIGNIRDACFFGSGGLIFLGRTSFEELPAMLVTLALCKSCGGPMVEMVECEWGICNSCSVKCAHDYERGAVHGGGVDVAMGEFCKTCGRAKPKAADEPEKSQAERHMEVERELGVTILYKNSGLTPEQRDALDKQKN